jgi:hypothetical protein
MWKLPRGFIVCSLDSWESGNRDALYCTEHANMLITDERFTLLLVKRWIKAALPLLLAYPYP